MGKLLLSVGITWGVVARVFILILLVVFLGQAVMAVRMQRLVSQFYCVKSVAGM